MNEQEAIEQFAERQIAIMQINLKEYLKIGTVEECRVAVEKQNNIKG